MAVALAPMAVALGLAPTLAWLTCLRPFQKALGQPLLFPQRAPMAVALAPMAVALGLAPTLAWLNYLRPFQKAL